MKVVYGREYFAREAINDVPEETQALFQRAWALVPPSLNFNLVKVDKRDESVTFAFYPHLATHAHPFLKESVKVSIKTGKVSFKRESQSNPVILHRLETMLRADDPRISILEKITQVEESLGMYGKGCINFIGRRSYWNELCKTNNIESSKSPVEKEVHTHNGIQSTLFEEVDMVIQRSKTAMNIKTPSLPTKAFLKLCNIEGAFFDWGCGNGRDSRYLEGLGYTVYSYDKFLKPVPNPNDVDFSKVGAIICNYVVNVIESPQERDELLTEIFNKAVPGTKILISARSYDEIEDKAGHSNWPKMADGYLTGKKTFQKGFKEDELTELLRGRGNIIKAQRTPNYVFVIVETNKQ